MEVVVSKTSPRVALSAHLRERTARVLAASLALAAGFADSSGYLRWHLFAANMTGNTVLFGISIVSRDLRQAGFVVAPIAGFFAGCIIAKSLLERFGPTKLLTLEIGVLTIAALLEDTRFGLVLVALAMGLQNTARAEFAEVKANTSFITGDYSSAAQAVVDLFRRRDVSAQRRTLTVLGSIIACYAVGAACAGALAGMHVAHALLFLLPVIAAVAYAARFA
jgi:uncharacterized membrane protein YoaK (UPF0700 family)